MRCGKAFAMLLALAGCSGTAGTRAATALPAPRAVSYGAFDRVGYATWYGEEMEGRRTASGARFDPSAITAAHRTLPLNSMVQVTALDSGRTIMVRINDRGPGQRDREIDLSRGAARLLGIDRNPLAAVRIRNVLPPYDAVASRRGTRFEAGQLAMQRQRLPALALTATIRPAGAPPLTRAGRYLVQAAAFSNEDRATALAKRLHGIAVRAGQLWRVRIGPFDRLEQAQRMRDDAAQRGYGDAQIVPFD